MAAKLKIVFHMLISHWQISGRYWAPTNLAPFLGPSKVQQYQVTLHCWLRTFRLHHVSCVNQPPLIVAASASRPTVAGRAETFGEEEREGRCVPALQGSGGVWRLDQPLFAAVTLRGGLGWVNPVWSGLGGVSPLPRLLYYTASESRTFPPTTASRMTPTLRSARPQSERARLTKRARARWGRDPSLSWRVAFSRQPAAPKKSEAPRSDAVSEQDAVPTSCGLLRFRTVAQEVD
ncbi:hypothetical protein SKAU_G00247770 [Synaphobranchus kaupii]|uniref:Uncharacterized protein n=1 Tax=Synaphobranchus kaupii TaxID=118154 RepID=A0A9Q1F277_SYNKA|nr:hypothetical protein SKAU_G00247770 [Synaphobranchus kaupii]